MDRKGRASELFERFQSGGEATIDQFIAEEVSEELFLDYKRVTNEGAKARLEQSDLENYARAISGFGNSEGGIIVWGVDCRHDPDRGDVPSTKHPIKKVKRFLSYLEGATSGCTIPPHGDVQHYLIKQVGSDDGFVISLIQKSLFAPHQCIIGKHKGRYHIRVGSTFEQASHGLLAGMFGKRPDTNLIHMWKVGGAFSPANYPLQPGSYSHVINTLPTSTAYARAVFVLCNRGHAVAKDLYVNCSFALPGPNCVLRIPPNVKGWIHNEAVQGWHHFIAAEGYRLAPAAMVNVPDVKIFLVPPLDRGLWYEISFGCEGTQVSRLVKSVPVDEISAAYSTFVGSDREREAGRIFGKAVFGVGDNPDYAEGVE